MLPQLAYVSVFLCCLVLGRFTQAALGQGKLEIQSGDRIIFVGDDLMEVNELNRTPTFPVLVETFLTVRYPSLKVSYENTAWAGDVGERVSLRLDRDVLSRKPTVVVICLGMNDTKYSTYEGHEQFLEEYKGHLASIVKRCKEAGTRVWLVSPPGAWEESGQRLRLQRDARVDYVDLAAVNYNATLARYVQVMQEIARQQGVGFVDWFSPMRVERERLKFNKALNNEFYMASEPRVPRTAGQLIAATALLKAWGAEPIDAEIRVNWLTGSIEATSRMGDAPKALEANLTVHADGRRVIEVKGLPLAWPIPGARTSMSEAQTASEELSKIRLFVEHAPAMGLQFVREAADEVPGADLTIPAAQAEQGYNIAAMPLLQISHESNELARYITFKGTYLFNAWRKLELNPPVELELVEPQRRLAAVWREYAAAYEKLIAASPKHYTLQCSLSEAQPKPKEEPAATRPTSTAPRTIAPPLVAPPRN